MRLLNPLCEIHSSSEGAWAQRAPEELAAALVAAGEKRELESGQRLFSCGETAGGVFLILKGRARAVLPGAEGRELMALTAGPGAVLGIPAALCSKKYQFDVDALERLELAYLPQEQLNSLLLEHPELGMLVMTMMCNEMSALRQTREHLSRCQNQQCGLHGYCVQAASQA